MTRPDALGGLAACLRGDVPDGIDWDAVLELANRSLVSPRLAYSLAPAASVPDDVQSFLVVMQTRNRERNRRLLAQLSEALAALATAGIRPILLKGTVVLATGDAETLSSRVLSDIDLLVRPAELDLAARRLADIGYDRHRSPAIRGAPVVLARPCDVGMIDIHPIVKGGSVTLDFNWFAGGAAWRAVGGMPVMVPSATCQAAHLFVHDQLKGRDHVRGLIDLRHLLDLQRLGAEPGGVDWQAMAATLPDRRTRAALGSYLLTAQRLLHLDIPEAVLVGTLSRFHYRRQRLQAKRPALTGPLTLLALLLDPIEMLSSGARRLAKAVADVRSRGWQPAVRSVGGDARRLLRGRIWGKV